MEAGEKLGFLPGDLAQKVDPYLRPLNDALHEMMGVDAYQRLVERGQIEVAPLAYMRGRTLNDAFIILDEAQNTTSEQMKMFLTRMGMNSHMVITGDVTQIDLPAGKKSGLVEAVEVLRDVKDIAIVHLSAQGRCASRTGTWPLCRLTKSTRHARKRSAAQSAASGPLRREEPWRRS